MSRLHDKAHTLFIASRDGDLKWYVNGPCEGMGRNEGTLWPWSRFNTESAADTAAKLCVKAYQRGVEDALKEVRSALGLTK